MMADFLIIGGGIAGISATARLSALGKVLVCEAEEDLAYHASGRSAALFEQNYGSPPTVELNKASYAHHAQAGVLSPRGFMIVGKAEEEDAFTHDAKAMNLQPISFAEAQAIVPILHPESIAMVAHSGAAQDIDTDMLVQGFAREARKNAAEIMTSAKVESISRTQTGWSVKTAKGHYEGRILVNAAGAWVDQVAAMANIKPLGFTPMRRSIARLAPPGGHDTSNWPMLFGPGETWYAKPDAGALLVSPADEDQMEPHDAWADDMVLAEGLARYEEMVTEPVTRPIATWAGLRTFAPDRALVIGFSPEDPSYFWFAGQGGYGMQTSPASSQLAADLIAGRPSVLDDATIAALSPNRFA